MGRAVGAEDFGADAGTDQCGFPQARRRRGGDHRESGRFQGRRCVPVAMRPQIVAALAFALPALLSAQGQPDPDIVRRIADLRGAIERNELTSATTLATGLDDEVQARYRAWLIRDAGARVEESLQWL